MNHFLPNACRLESFWHQRIAPALAGAMGVALNIGLMAALIYLLVACGSLISSPRARAQTGQPAAGVRLEAGIEKENVDGDLKSAMGIYEQIASDASAPRDVRARALLRLAGCEEKLGQQARRVYEQILRDYADQPVAAQARARLAAMKQPQKPSAPPTMSVRKIDWAKLGQMRLEDTDGEHAVFIGPDGNLYSEDLAGHSRNLVFSVEKAPNLGNKSNLLAYCLSRDFSMVGLFLANTKNYPSVLAEVKADGTGYRELIRDDDEKLFGVGLVSYDSAWSRDDRYIAVALNDRVKGNRLLIIDAKNGDYRDLVRSDYDTLGAVRFSPDGRFIAYETMQLQSNDGTGRIIVVPVGGGAPHVAMEFPKPATDELHSLKDWTADGRYLVITQPQHGKSALYLLPMKDGAPAGSSEFVRYGDFEGAESTASGALIYRDRTATLTDVDAYLGSLDSTGHIAAWEPLDLRGGLKLNDGFPWPSFSPDGDQIAYRAGGADPEQNVLVIRHLSTSRERVIYQSSHGTLTCQYSNVESKVFCALAGGNDGNKTDLFTVDDKTGVVVTTASLNGLKAMTHYPKDGKTFYFLDWGEKKFGVTRWDSVTEQETMIVPGPQSSESVELPSFDGEWLIHSTAEGMSIRPTAGGDWKTLVSGVKGFYSLNDTTHDGKWVFFSVFDWSGQPGLFRVPTTGGTPERLGDLPHPLFQAKLYSSGDGRKILAINTNPQKYDFWLMENFEPPVKK